MTFSKRASDFLNKSKRETYLLTESDIRKVFVANDAPIFDPLIDFQLRFGGYIFSAGLEPIKFSLLKGEGGYPEANYTAIIDFQKSNLESPNFFFDCASTNYQMQFFLDENGVYYEDYEAKASSFNKTVEHLALWNEIRLRDGYEVICRNRRIHKNNIETELKLELLPEASDNYTSWFCNEHVYLEQCQGLSTLIVSKNYSEKRRFLTL
jgi:hypothetical protein